MMMEYFISRTGDVDGRNVVHNFHPFIDFQFMKEILHFLWYRSGAQLSLIHRFSI